MDGEGLVTDEYPALLPARKLNKKEPRQTYPPVNRYVSAVRETDWRSTAVVVKVDDQLGDAPTGELLHGGFDIILELVEVV